MGQTDTREGLEKLLPASTLKDMDSFLSNDTDEGAALRDLCFALLFKKTFLFVCLLEGQNCRQRRLDTKREEQDLFAGLLPQTVAVVGAGPD